MLRTPILPRLAAAALASLLAAGSLHAAQGHHDREGGHEDCTPERAIVAMRPQVDWWARDGAPVALAAQLNDASGAAAGARWTLLITTFDGSVVDRRAGVSRLAEGDGFALVNFDGKDADGHPIEPGLYVYRFEVPGYESTGGFLRIWGSDETPAPKVDDVRQPLAASSNPSVPYQFFFGAQHAHTNYSDGGIANASCTGSKSGPHAGATPVDAFAYAKASGNVDWICVIEHNHLMDDACGTCTTAVVRQRYQDGLSAATAATTSSFVGLYGMEWGVISNGGHVALYDTTKLFSWEAYADVTTAKYDYAALWNTANNAAYQGTSGAAGAFCHPGTSDYGSFSQNAAGVSFVTGMALISGPAFNNTTNFADGGSRYAGPKKSGTDMYNYALQRGWKIGPEAHADNHCWNYGNSTRNRTVVLASSLSKASVMGALRARRFYASSDLNAQLFFGTSDYAHVMGETFTSASATLDLRVWASDPDGATIQSVAVYQGDPAAGTGSPTAVTMTSAGAGSYTGAATLPATGTSYFYTYVTLSNGAELWSAPIWVSRTSCSDSTAPTATVTAPTASTVTGTVSVTASGTDNVGVTGMALKIDGTQVASSASGSISYSWNTSALTAGSSHTIVATSTDACGNVGTSTTKTVTIGSSCTDSTAPTATVTAPTASTVSGTVSVTATGTDNVAVTGMTLKIDGTQVATSTSGSISYSWNTSALTAGSSHTIVATSTDACGNVGTSATKTVTIASSGFVSPIGNPGFETGTAAPWVETGSYEQISGTGTAVDGTSVAPHGGTKMDWMAGYDSADDFLYQGFTVPNVSGNVNLSFWLRTVTTDGTTTAYDYLYVDVYNSAGTTRLGTLATYSNKNAAGWAQKTFSLNSYKGQAIRLRLHATNDTSNPTDFFVDDFNMTNP